MKPIKVYIYFSHSAKVDIKTHTKHCFLFPQLFKTASQVKPSRLSLFKHKVLPHLSQEKGFGLNDLENNTLSPQMRLKKIMKMPLSVFLLSFCLRLNSKVEACKWEEERDLTPPTKISLLSKGNSEQSTLIY